MEPDKGLCDEIVRIRLILDVAPREREQGPLPSGDQFVERGVAPILQRLQPGLIAGGVGIHGDSLRSLSS